MSDALILVISSAEIPPTAAAADLSMTITYEQCPDENKMIGCLQNAAGKYEGIIINTGDMPYSDALCRAVAATSLPCVEVAPAGSGESSSSAIAAACVGVVGGFGDGSYTLALQALAHTITTRR